MIPSPNVQFGYPNFAFDGSDFYNIDHQTSRLIRKNSTGSIVTTFPIISNDLINDLTREVTSLKFTGGAFEAGIVQGNASLWTLESEVDSQNITTALTIRRFNLKDAILRFSTTKTPTGDIRPDVFRYVSRSGQNYKSSSIAVEYHRSVTSFPIEPGSSSIYFPDIVRLVPNSRIVIGPSESSYNYGKVEENEIVSIGAFDSDKNGYRINLRYPVTYDYNSGTNIIYHTYIYLFNDYNYRVDDGQGCLFKIRAIDGAISSVFTGIIYKDVTGAVFSPELNRILFTKGNQLLYLHPDSLTYTDSVILDNVDTNKNPALPIYDLSISDSFIYRLQNQVADFDNMLIHNYGSYNYIKTNVPQNVASISVRPHLQAIIANEYDTTFIDVHVVDQYGFPLAGEIVNIDAVALAGGEGVFLTFSSSDPQDQANSTQKETNDDGFVRFKYKAGPAQDIVKFNVTAVSNNTVGFSYVYQYLSSSDRVLVKQLSGLADRALFRQIGSINGQSNIVLYKNFGFPSVQATYNNGTPENDYRDMHNGNRDIDWAFWGEDYNEIVGGGGTAPEFHPIVRAAPKILSQSFEDITAECLILYTSTVEGLVLINQLGETKTDKALVRMFGDIDTETTVLQYDFSISFVPEPLAIKVPRNTNIYAKIKDIPGTNINIQTVKLTVNEQVVTGDCIINYVANQYLEILYNPPGLFEFGSRVFVAISFFDQAAIPNFIEIPYYFDIIEDYKAPVVYNFYPDKNEVDVPLDAEISFDIYDEGSGTDIDTLELYINNIKVSPVVDNESEVYHVSFTPAIPFKNMQDMSIYLSVEDNMGNKSIHNYLFMTKPSSPPEIIMVSPYNCFPFASRNQNIVFELYSTGDGIRLETVRVNINGVDRRFAVNKLVKRIE